MLKLSMAFFTLDRDDVERLKQHLVLDCKWTAEKVEQWWSQNRIWWYKQKTIRKSLYHNDAAGLKRSLEAFMDDMVRPQAAQQNKVSQPLDAETVQKLEELNARVCSLIDAGIITGEHLHLYSFVMQVHVSMTKV